MTRLPLARTAIALLVAGTVLFFLGSVGQEDGGRWADGPAWLGAVGWFGFLLCLLLLLVVGLVAVVRRVVSGSRAATG